MPTLRIHRRALLLACAGLLLAVPAPADDLVIYRGKVTLEDGSPPGHMVMIVRTCQGEQQSTNQGAASAKTGEYFVKLHVSEFGQVGGGMDTYALLPCVLEVLDKGFASSQIDLSDRLILRNPRLPDIVLTPVTSATLLVNRNAPVPHAASRDWDSAFKQITAHNWQGAELSLQAVVEAAPKFAPAWAALGTIYSNLEKPQEARQALERAIQIDPKPLPPLLSLVHALIDLREWKTAADAAATLIARDTRHVYAEALFLSAFALYQLQDYDNAQSRIEDAIRFDKLHEMGHAEYLLGLILEGKRDYAGAELHMKAYIRQNPRADDLAQVHDRLKNLGSTALADLATALKPLDLRAAPTGEAPVPGGIKAFSTIAQLKGTPTAENFYLEYCRAITTGGPFAVNPTKEASEEIRAFISTVAALEALGEHRENGVLIRLGWNGDAEIRKSRAILAELGWKLASSGDSYTLEPGDRPKDGARQWALVGFGVDEVTLRQALREKREFTFEIPHETARLVGGPSWGLVQKDLPDMATGPADLFIKDWRFARVYSGLGAMDNDSATAVVGAMGLANLIVKYSVSMADYGDAIRVTGKHVMVPGGAGADAVWAKLVGASPQQPLPFLRALFEKDQGRLLAFYYDLARADAQHQQFFTASPDRAEAFYKCYRDSAAPTVVAHVGEHWQRQFLQELRLDQSGQLIFPGGRSVWIEGPGSDDYVLLSLPSLEAFTAVSHLETKRGARLSTPAARLLVDRFAQWRSLFPYFEKLPGLDTAEFRSLADFTEEASRAPGPRRNLLLGEWHSLVELIVLGAQSGGLNDQRAAQAFRQACDALRSANPSAAAIATVRDMAGGAADIDDALVGQVLRISGVRRDAFEEIKKLQSVPRLSSLGAQPEAGRTLIALSGAVYASILDPAYLLVAEDPHLLAKHAFVSGPNLFAPSSLKISSEAPGTSFIGGFASFADAARELRQRVVGVPLAGPEDDASSTQSAAVSAGGPAPPPAGDLIFRAGGRIVEVYATVVDGRGHYIDNLTANQFSILEEGQSKPVFAFENHNSAVSVALLFDTTGSMVDALPSLKNAAVRLVNQLRPTDSVAVYSFADAVTELQPFTEDKEAAERAILKTHAQGITALYDALIRVNHDLAARPGKKVIIVFTDGSDNSSMLTAANAIERAKSRGIPIYTIAQGEALQHANLLTELTNVSRSTGGSTFQIHQLNDIDSVFEKVSQDLLHGYLVAFQPAPGDNHAWRRIEVVLSGAKGLRVRAREGFFVE